jgi:hypothetical protein
MPFSNGKTQWNETVWTEEKIQYLKDNFWTRTNVQLSKDVGITLTVVRNKLRELGLKKMEMEYWTEEQEQFLRDNYKKIGDVEMAEIFEKKWPKKKTWSHKHIRKKRVYLNLHRKEKDIIGIMQRYVDAGRMNLHSKGKTNWLTTGPAKQGEIRMYRSCYGVISPRIKIGRRWLWWQRWAWIKKYGPIPAGMVVVFKDSNPYNTKVKNLELVTRSEATSRYAAASSKNLSDKYVAAQLAGHNKEMAKELIKHPELIDTHRTLLLLKRKIKEHVKQKRSSAAA